MSERSRAHRRRYNGRRQAVHQYAARSAVDRATVTFHPQGAVVSAAVGSTVAEVARVAGVRVEVPCGGTGVCGGCAVVAEGDVSEPTADERRALSAADLARGVRLACRARVLGAVTVRPVSARVAGATRAVTSAAVEGYPVAAPGERHEATGARTLGAAVDVGTTTLAAALVDLRNGDVLATAAADNPQAAFGADVLARVAAAGTRGVEALQASVAGAVEALVTGLLAREGASPAALLEVVTAGNPAMTHLLYGIDPSPLAAAPYAGALTAPMRRTAASLGMGALGEVRVSSLPAVSAFVGGDAVAGAVVTRLADAPRGTLLVDLGTNGEVLLATGDGLLATSAAAGPAFEGGAIECGMRAEDGAIERVQWADGRLAVGTVGGAPARGICGSGLLDLVAALLDAGILDSEGRMRAAGPLGARARERDGEVVFEVADGVVLTQGDVRAVQLACGAVRAACTLLLEEARVPRGSVPRVRIAGGFGYHACERSLLRLGVLDESWAGRVHAAGNTSLAGAVAVLASPAAREAAEVVAAAARTLDLAPHPRFREVFVASLAFPDRP
ncbi:MAG: DUF4445 domain-containing protein [Actinobacteria bacterium]|nr:MAG: DUF4445 domain-containing protein [Actinomycetota bacterium]